MRLNRTVEVFAIQKVEVIVWADAILVMKTNTGNESLPTFRVRNSATTWPKFSSTT